MSHLFLVGNGFDLACGLETSYGHFFKYLFDCEKSNPGSMSKIFGSGLLDQYRDFDDFCTARTLPPIGLFKNRIVTKFYNESKNSSNWSDFESIIGEELKLLLDKNASIAAIEALNTEIIELRELLHQYLAKITSDTSENHPRYYNQILKCFMPNKEDGLCVNFNYTKTLKSILPSEFKVINVHGALSSNSDGILLGYGFSEEELIKYRGLMSNRVRLAHKESNYSLFPGKNELLDYLDDKGKENVVVHVLGLSLGDSDHELLRALFVHDSVKHVQLYPFDNRDNFKDLSTNLYRAVNDDSKVKRKLIAYDPKSIIPKIENDSVNRQTEFGEFLSKLKKKFDDDMQILRFL
jgi:hypothetical protein